MDGAVRKNVKEERDMSLFLYGNGIALTERALDLLWMRQNITLNNIANDDTPDFKSQYLTFEDALAEQVKEASATGSAGNVRSAISRPLCIRRRMRRIVWTEITWTCRRNRLIWSERLINISTWLIP